MKSTAVSATPDAEYRRQLALFVSSTNEKQIEIAKLSRIAARLPRREAFLDVGPGSGEITAALAQYFKRTAVIEPNREFQRLLSRRYPHFQIIKDRLQDVVLPTNAYDLVLCSHMLYYAPEDTWLDLAERMHAALRPGGKLLIVLQSPHGDVADFIARFAGIAVNSTGLWAGLVWRFGERRVKAAYSFFECRTATLDDLTDIGLFFLLDPKFRRQRAAIRRYFAQHHKWRDGYCLDQGQIILEVLKTSRVRR